MWSPMHFPEILDTAIPSRKLITGWKVLSLASTWVLHHYIFSQTLVPHCDQSQMHISSFLCTYTMYFFTKKGAARINYCKKTRRFIDYQLDESGKPLFYPTLLCNYWYIFIVFLCWCNYWYLGFTTSSLYLPLLHVSTGLLSALPIKSFKAQLGILYWLLLLLLKSFN